MWPKSLGPVSCYQVRNDTMWYGIEMRNYLFRKRRLVTWWCIKKTGIQERCWWFHFFGGGRLLISTSWCLSGRERGLRSWGYLKSFHKLRSSQISKHILERWFQSSCFSGGTLQIKPYTRTFFWGGWVCTVCVF